MSVFEDHSPEVRETITRLMDLEGRRIMFGLYMTNPSTSRGKEGIPFIQEQILTTRITGVRVCSTGRENEERSSWAALMINPVFMSGDNTPVNYITIRQSFAGKITVGTTILMEGTTTRMAPPGDTLPRSEIVWVRIL